MEIFAKKLLANIDFAMLRFLDKVFSLFGILSGTEDVTGDGQEPTDIVSFFLNNSTLMSVFYWILLISVMLLTFFTIAGLIKNIVITKRAQSKTLLAAGGSVIAFFLVLIVLMGAIAVSTQVLRLVNDGFNVNNELTLSQRIFDLSVEENGWRENKNNDTFNSAEDFNPRDNADKVFGKYETWFGFEKTPGAMEEVDDGNGGTEYVSSNDTYRPSSGGIADLYKTNLLVLSLGSIIIFFVIMKSVISLARRIFEILELFLLMPMTVSSIPLDDGSRFKLWRESMAAKVLSVFGTVVSLNLYILYLGLIGGINQAVTDGWILELILMIGGALAISSSAALFSHLIGANQEPMQNLGQTIYSGMMAGQAVAGIGRGIFGTIFGRKGGGGAGGGDGKRHGGIIRGAGKIGDKAGKIMFGNRYVDFKNGAGANYQKLKESLKGKYMNNGGIAGMSKDAYGKIRSTMANAGETMKGKISDMIGLQDI